MKLVAAKKVEENGPANIETVILPETQLHRLGRVAAAVNPDMPMAFAGAHIIRTLLERFEEADIDLTGATSEEELTRIAARGLRERNRQSRRTRG